MNRRWAGGSKLAVLTRNSPGGEAGSASYCTFSPASLNQSPVFVFVRNLVKVLIYLNLEEDKVLTVDDIKHVYEVMMMMMMKLRFAGGVDDERPEGGNCGPGF